MTIKNGKSKMITIKRWAEWLLSRRTEGLYCLHREGGTMRVNFPASDDLAAEEEAMKRATIFEQKERPTK